jgi:signal transduction histidine kinase/ActR/RegA family two-component response regulator
MSGRGLRDIWASLARSLGRALGGQALVQAEAEARLARDRLREAIDVFPEGVVFLDDEGRYILWNRRYAEIYHRSADLFAPGRKLADTLRVGVARGDYPDAVGREEEWLAERLAKLEHATGERLEQQLSDGRWLLIEERRLSDGGVIGVRIDITEMKRQAQALEEALQRAEAANRARSEFLANVSHELLTPLNGVIGMAQVLGRTRLDPHQQEMLRTIAGSAAALETLIGDLLDYNSLEAGKIELSPAWFDVAGLAAAVAAGFRSQAEAKGVALVVEVSPQVEGEAFGDARPIRQLLDQLLSNAVKFTAQGQVTLTVEAQAAPQGQVYRFRVCDTGPGFDDTDAERLFGQFQQADGSVTREHGGVGLGLAICRRLADLLGGTVEVRSAPGQGAAFTLTLVLPSRPTADPHAAEGPPLRVLIADDNPTNRRVIEMILAAAEAEAVSVENGLEAVHAIQAAPFDVILMDLQMPVMDGYAAIRAIREAEAAAGGAAHTPIIVISANATAQDRDASARAGADRHIAKPVRAEALFGAITEVLEA